MECGGRTGSSASLTAPLRETVRHVPMGDSGQWRRRRLRGGARTLGRATTPSVLCLGEYSICIRRWLVMADTASMCSARHSPLSSSQGETSRCQLTFEYVPVLEMPDARDDELQFMYKSLTKSGSVR